MAQYKNFFLRQIVSQSTYHILFCTFKKYMFRKSKSTYSLSPKCPHDPYRKKKKNLISLPFKSHESQTQTFEGYCESAEPRKNSIPSSDHPITIYIHRGTKGIAIETKKQNTIFAKLNPHFVAIRRPVAPCYPHPTYLYIYCPFNSLKILRFHGGTIAGEQLGGSGGMKANKCKQKENAGSTMAFDFIGPPLDACYTPGNRTRFSIPPPSIIPTVCVSAFYEPPLSPRPCSKTETRFED